MREHKTKKISQDRSKQKKVVSAYSCEKEAWLYAYMYVTFKWLTKQKQEHTVIEKQNKIQKRKTKSQVMNGVMISYGYLLSWRPDEAACLQWI